MSLDVKDGNVELRLAYNCKLSSYLERLTEEVGSLSHNVHYTAEELIG